VRSVFSVFKGASFLLTDSSSIALHRLSDGNPADPLLADWGQINYLGKVYVNGVEEVNPTGNAMPTSLHNGYNLVEIVGNGNPMALDSFNKDRGFLHAGNQSHAETLLYDTVVSDAQRLVIEAYLNKKWFGIGDGVTNQLPASSALVLANGAVLNLGISKQTFTRLSGTGSVSNGALCVTGLVQPGGSNTVGTLKVPANTVMTGTLQVDAMTDGSCDVLAVQGAADLSTASLTVLKASTLDATRIYTVLTCTGTPSRFASASVPPGWELRYKNGSVQLVSSGTLVLFF